MNMFKVRKVIRFFRSIHLVNVANTTETVLGKTSGI